MEPKNEQHNQPYMYILVNDDLKMGKGKIAGQVGHVVGLITEKIIQDYYESNKKPSDIYLRYLTWKRTGIAKIVLKATEEQIKTFIGEPETIYILDAGKTQIAPNSLTVIGFFPNTTNKEKFKDFKLL